MKTSIKMLLLSAAFVPFTVMADDVTDKINAPFMQAQEGSAEAINRDIESKPTAAGDGLEARLANREKRVPGTLDVHFNPNLLWVPGRSAGDL